LASSGGENPLDLVNERMESVGLGDHADIASWYRGRIYQIENDGTTPNGFWRDMVADATKRARDGEAPQSLQHTMELYVNDARSIQESQKAVTGFKPAVLDELKKDGIIVRHGDGYSLTGGGAQLVRKQGSAEKLMEALNVRGIPIDLDEARHLTNQFQRSDNIGRALVKGEFMKDKYPDYPSVTYDMQGIGGRNSAAILEEIANLGPLSGDMKTSAAKIWERTGVAAEKVTEEMNKTSGTTKAAVRDKLGSRYDRYVVDELSSGDDGKFVLRPDTPDSVRKEIYEAIADSNPNRHFALRVGAGSRPTQAEEFSKIWEAKFKHKMNKVFDRSNYRIQTVVETEFDRATQTTTYNVRIVGRDVPRIGCHNLIKMVEESILFTPMTLDHRAQGGKIICN
jgi:hypothetical protein